MANKKKAIKLRMESLNEFIKQYEEATEGGGAAEIAVAVWNMACKYRNEGISNFAYDHDICVGD